MNELLGGLDAELHNWPDGLRITAVSTLESAGPGHLALIGAAKWIKVAEDSRAGAFLVGRNLLAEAKETLGARPFISVDSPWLALRHILDRMHPDKTHPWQGIHPTATVHETAVLGAGVVVGPSAVIGPNATIGAGTRIGAGCFVGPDSRIGADCSLHANVVLEQGTRLGDRVILHAGVVLGADGFKYEMIGSRREKIPQVGIVVVEDDVEIGANTCVDRASFTETRIGARTKIDNLVQIGHNVTIGADSVVVAQVGVGGSTRIGTGVVLAGQVGLADNIAIGEQVVVLARSAVMNDVEPRKVVMGEPARPHRQNLRILAAVDGLPESIKELKRLGSEVRELLGRIEALESRQRRQEDGQ